MIEFNRIIASIKDGAILKQLEAAIELNDVDAVYDILGINESTFSPISEIVRQSYIRGGVTGALQIGRIPKNDNMVAFNYNVRNQRAEEWLFNESSRLIVEITESQRELVRDVMLDGMAVGDNPKTTAKNLVGRVDKSKNRRVGGVIGLTNQQAGWIGSAKQELKDLDENYFTRELRDKRLDGQIKKAIRDGKKLDAKLLNLAIERMQEKTLKYRSETISRTESITALRAGQYEAIAQAIDEGGVVASDVIKKWDATGGHRTRHWHNQAEQDYRDGIPLDEPFVVAGEMLMYAGDTSLGATGKNTINCRCRMIAEIDFGKKLARLEGFA